MTTPFFMVPQEVYLELIHKHLEFRIMVSLYYHLNRSSVVKTSFRKIAREVNCDPKRVHQIAQNNGFEMVKGELQKLEYSTKNSTKNSTLKPIKKLDVTNNRSTKNSTKNSTDEVPHILVKEHKRTLKNNIGGEKLSRKSPDKIAGAKKKFSEAEKALAESKLDVKFSFFWGIFRKMKRQGTKTRGDTFRLWQEITKTRDPDFLIYAAKKYFRDCQKTNKETKWQKTAFYWLQDAFYSNWEENWEEDQDEYLRNHANYGDQR